METDSVIQARLDIQRLTNLLHVGWNLRCASFRVAQDLCHSWVTFYIFMGT